MQFKRILCLALVLLITACTPNTQTQTVISQETAEVTAFQEELYPTQTATSTPEIPTVLLITASEGDPELLTRTREILQPLVSDAGMILREAEGLTAESIMPEVRVVVAVGKGIPLNDLAAGRLEIQFIAVNNPDAVVAENVSIAGDPDQDQKRQSFMAGYLAAVVSEDYKVAAMVPANDASGSLASDSFVTGARFYCGLCKPKYPPYGSFPQWESFPAGSEMSVWRPLVDAFSNAGVEVMYLQSQIMSVELLTYLAETGIKVIGDSSPDMDRNFWVGTIALDPEQTLVEIWQSALDGEGGIQKPFSIALMDQEAGLVSEGRARLFKEMLEDLEAGEVLPESSP